MVLRELQEARGNVESLRRRVKKCTGKLAECRGRGDLTGGGGGASERVLEGNRRVREAQNAVEVLERELHGMGGGVQVKQEGGVNDDEIVELGEVVVDEKNEERRANSGVKREEEEGGGGEGEGKWEGEGDDAGGVLHITEWMRNRLGSSLAAKAAHFPWTRGMVAPPPLTSVSYEPPTPPFTRSVAYCSASCTSSCTARSSAIAAGGEDGSTPGGIPVSWVTGPGTGRTAPLPNDWLPSKAQKGKFLTAGSVSAGSCHWHLIFERWANHGLGEVRATPRKDTVIFRANWTRILRDGVYLVEDKGKYHGFVVGQTLSQPCALRVKCEDDAQRQQQSAIWAVLAERERTPTSQLRQALAAIKENVDTRVRVCPPRKHVHMATRAQKMQMVGVPVHCFGDVPNSLFWRRSNLSPKNV